MLLLQCCTRCTGIGNLRIPRFQSEADPQKTMRFLVEFGLYSGVRGRRAQIQSQNDSWVWNITPAIVVNQRKWDRMGPEKVNVMKGFGRAPLGCCCSAFSARRCGTATRDLLALQSPTTLNICPPRRGRGVRGTLHADNPTVARQKHSSVMGRTSTRNEQLSLFSVPCYPCPCVPGQQSISTACGLPQTTPLRRIPRPTSRIRFPYRS